MALLDDAPIGLVGIVGLRTTLIRQLAAHLLWYAKIVALLHLFVVLNRGGRLASVALNGKLLNLVGMLHAFLGRSARSLLHGLVALQPSDEVVGDERGDRDYADLLGHHGLPLLAWFLVLWEV